MSDVPLYGLMHVVMAGMRRRRQQLARRRMTKVDIRLLEKGDSHFHGARPVH